jgi:ubiquinone/menaquinone biosynthesis C-methylase UbiE
VALNPFARRDNPYLLVLGMTGVKLGDRLLQIGCANGKRLAAVAGKVGLSGRAVVVVRDEEEATRARKGAADQGVLLEIETGRVTELPVESNAFDLAIVDDTSGLMSSMSNPDRRQMLRETQRALRAGGRVMVIGTTARSGLAALLARGESAPSFDAVPLLQAEGFRSARRLAERDGLSFIEAIKPRD